MHCNKYYSLSQYHSGACGITVTDPGSDNTIILTGGSGPINTVAIYGYNVVYQVYII